MTDDIVLFVLVLILGKLLHELGSAGEGDLVDVALDFILRHADAGIVNGDGFLFLVDSNKHLHVLVRALVKHTVLRDSVAGIADHFTKEDVLI